MADTKISAFGAAPSFGNADILAGVVAGADAKVTKQQILDAKAGENIQISGAAGQLWSVVFASLQAYMQIYDNGAVNLHGIGTVQIGNLGGGANLNISSTGNVSLLANGMGATASYGVGGGPSVVFNAMGGTIVFTAGGGMTCPYLDGTGGAWTPAAPTNYNAAIDRLAVAIRASGWAGVL